MAKPNKQKELQGLRDRTKRARPTKLAAGISYTLERQRGFGTFRGHGSTDVLHLAVKGTTDPLATTFGSIAKKRCACCGGTGRVGYELTKVGQRRLAKLRNATKKEGT